MGRRRDLTGGGLIRSAGGWKALEAFHRLRIRLKGDERILGESDFAEQVLSSVKQPQRVRARSVLCYWAVQELEIRGADVARRLNVSKSAVSRAVARREKIVSDMALKLIEN